MIKNFINTIKRFRLFTLLNLLGLTIALLIFTVIATQVNIEMHRDTSYPDSEQIYILQHQSLGEKDQWGALFSQPFYNNLSSIIPQAEQFAIRSFSSISIGGERYKFKSSNTDNPVFHCSNSKISRSFVDMFDIQIVEGAIGSDDEPWLIIPQSIAKKYFPNGSAVGQMLSLVDSDQASRTVSAVYRDLPSSSSFLNEFYFNIGNDDSDNWGNFRFRTFIKLPATTTIADAEKQINKYMVKTIGSIRLTPIVDLHFTKDSSPYDQDIVSNNSRQMLMIFILIAILIVCVASANYVNFTTALIPPRIKDFNIRKIYGATQTSIRIQIISESLLMYLIAAFISIGVLLSFDTLDAVSFISTKIIIAEHLPFITIVTLTIAVVIGLASGIYPAFYATTIKTSYVLKGSFAVSGKGKRLRSTLVGMQYVFSIALITMAIIMNLQYNVLNKQEMGFNRQNVLNVQISKKLFSTSFENVLLSRPDITEVTYTNRSPFFSTNNLRWGRNYRDTMILFDAINVSRSFPKFFDIPIVEGRDFDPSDDQMQQHSVLLFNQTAQKKYDIKVGDMIGEMLVVGIVKDINYKPLINTIEPMAFSNIGDTSTASLGNMNMYLRCNSSDYHALIDFIRSQGSAFDPDWDADISFMDSRIEEQYQKESKTVQQINLSSALAIIISLLGVFGLIHFDIQRRRKELALRKINGASMAVILILFNKQFVSMIAICFVIAAPLTWLVADNWLSQFAYRTPIHWWIFATALLIVLLITIVTITVQSWRTASENPIRSLKSE